MEKSFLAIDLGAGSGRAILGTLADGSVRLREVHRFANRPVTLGDTLYWDLPGLFKEVVRGIGLAAAETDGHLDGISVDSWGVDFCLFDRRGRPLALPVHYRDTRTEGLLEEVFRTLPDSEIFAETGVRSLELNTLYQLLALKKQSPELLDAADKMLLIADTMHYFLCGRLVQEETLASSTQLWNPQTHAWSTRVVDAVGLPGRILPDVIAPATVLAPLADAIVEETGLRTPPPIIASASHDTALAIAAAPAPAGGESWAYLSSGTWSLLGVELATPHLGAAAREHHFTNEVGVGGTITFLTMINGLFLLEECRRRWAADGNALEHEALLEAARDAEASLIWPNDPTLFAPTDAPQAIRDFCRASGQAVPESAGAITRTILESLALTYRRGIDALEAVTGRTVEKLHIVGGGSQNGLLNQFTADALGRPSLAGPAEATAMGNVLVQALATKYLGSLHEVRQHARASCQMHEATPSDNEAWAMKLEGFRNLEQAATANGLCNDAERP